MSAGLDTRPKATQIDLEELTELAWAGKIRIPHFQRPLRWQRSDVIRLFDSIVRGYPVGSFLLWRRTSPADSFQFGALHIKGDATPNALWVVDGQQRIISLASALHPDGAQDHRFNLAYDLRTEQFVARPTVEEPTVIPLSVIFDLKQVLRWFTTHPEAIDYVDRANDITRTLRQFKIPAYEVTQDNPRVLQDIFDRMNNYGKRLSRAEIFSGLFAGEESVKDSQPTLDRIAQNIDDDLGFGLIDNDTLLQAVLARRGPDVKREIRNEFGDDGSSPSRRHNQASRAIIEFPGEDRDTAYNLAEDAIRLAVGFLQQEAGVPHFSVLPYRHLLVILTRLFAHFPNPDQRTRRLLRRWIWRAAVVGPEVFRGSTTGAIRFLSYAVKPDSLQGSVDRLLDLVEYPTASAPDLARFRSNEAATKIVLCAWWSLEPRSLTTGEPFERQELSTTLLDRQTAIDAVRYIVSRYSVPKELRMWAADRVLMPDPDAEVGTVDSLLLRDTSTQFESREWNAILTSHCIDQNALAALGAGDVTRFINVRQELLQRQLTQFLRQRCEWDFEDTPTIAGLILTDDDVDEEEDSDTLF